MQSEDLCQICRQVKFRYTCPKCNIAYCSVECYKSPQHLKCSEEFYKDCIQEELANSGSESTEDIKKIYEILKRIREFDAGIEFGDGLDGTLDSDDELEENEEEQEEDLAIRLHNIDINDTTKVWQRLTESEKEEFKKMVETGDIINLLPKCEPWWLKANSKIVDLSVEKNGNQSNQKPKLVQDIPRLTDIYKKTPSPCIHYNLWNILGAYTCTVRFFGAEHQRTPWDASAHLVNLSTTLKYNTNFEDVEDAMVSVQIEGISTVDPAEMKKDVKLLMLSQQNKLLALSDILDIFKLAREYIKNNKKEDDDFQKLFAACSGNIELNRKRLAELIKKTEFMLSFVMWGGVEE